MIDTVHIASWPEGYLPVRLGVPDARRVSWCSLLAAMIGGLG